MNIIPTGKSSKEREAEGSRRPASRGRCSEPQLSISTVQLCLSTAGDALAVVRTWSLILNKRERKAYFLNRTRDPEIVTGKKGNTSMPMVLGVNDQKITSQHTGPSLLSCM